MEEGTLATSKQQNQILLHLLIDQQNSAKGNCILWQTLPLSRYLTIQNFRSKLYHQIVTIIFFLAERKDINIQILEPKLICSN